MQIVFILTKKRTHIKQKNSVYKKLFVSSNNHGKYFVVFHENIMNWLQVYLYIKHNNSTCKFIVKEKKKKKSFISL